MSDTASTVRLQMSSDDDLDLTFMQSKKGLQELLSVRIVSVSVHHKLGLHKLPSLECVHWCGMLDSHAVQHHTSSSTVFKTSTKQHVNLNCTATY